MLLSEKQLSLIEQIGIYHESNGMQPAPARIMGLLMVADSAELTFDEITEALNISKSATSNAINLLLQTNLIEYTTFSGDRKRYFKLKISSWREGFTRKIDDLTGFAVLLRQVSEIRKRENSSSNEDLKDCIGFLDFLHKKLPFILEEWDNRKA
ncbi:GbsR/MarR family transcriptional regulator [Pontibacter arcticus]|uniref:MarR family transcriptional regulator n=1 Tax=Pontibacter arcticus TaxID=2080288 RepID=A0A364REV6_9BACT|nr:MarR family transcriptional regulator [Pontibacter arcticus]RAU82870.1 MarR family transcriptional regulator [Pontibacter arcticus]